MRKRHPNPLAVACLLVVGVACTSLLSWSAGAEPTTPAFRHGIGIHHALNWAKMEPGAAGRYVFPPFSDPTHCLVSADLNGIREAGFDFVRLTVDPGPFLQFDGAQRDELDAILIARLKMISAANLNVIIDFHPNEQNEEYRSLKLVESIDSSLFRAYRDLVAHTARLVRDFPGAVALEPMNEPQIGWNPTRTAEWQRMIESIYAAVRQAAPSLPIILSGGWGGSTAGLIALDPRPFSGDDHAIFTFHYYLPYEFTHQSVARSKFELLRDVPYPADGRPAAEAFASLEKTASASTSDIRKKESAVSAGEKALESYFASHFDRSSIRAAFDTVGKWAEQHHIPNQRILLGEFGVVGSYGSYHGARDEDRARWLADVRMEAENRGWPWAVWVYRGYGGMAIGPDPPARTGFDPVALRALGLGPDNRMRLSEMLGAAPASTRRGPLETCR